MVLLESEVSLKTGDIAPNFELVGTDDKKHTLNDYDKKKLLRKIQNALNNYKLINRD